jgi:hypothetical protein
MDNDRALIAFRHRNVLVTPRCRFRASFHPAFEFLNMRPILRLFFFAAVVGSASVAQAFVVLGHGRLIGTATARADYDSNIFVNDSEVGDYVGTFTGAVRYVRDASAFTMDAGAGITLLGFVDHDDQNAADPFVDAVIGYSPSDKTTIRGAFAYRRSSIANEIVNDRTQSNDLLLDGSITHLTTEKLGFRVAADYVTSNYQTSGYSDVFHYSAGVHGVYVYSPKLKLLAGITKLEWWTEHRAAGRRSPDSKDWRYTISAEGELTPKITGDVSAGLVQRDSGSSGFNDADALFLAGQVTWSAYEKTSFFSKVSQDLSVSAADQSVKALSFAVGMNHAISEKISFEGSAGVDRVRFQSFRGTDNREDDSWVVRSRLSYTYSDQMSFDVSGGYRQNDSNVAVSNYDRFNLGVGANLRF